MTGSLTTGEGFHIVLVEPRIPPNTGNVARLCAALSVPLDLVGELGFELSDRHLKRAGLDYWPLVDIRIHPDVRAFFEGIPEKRLHLFSKREGALHTAVHYQPGDYLVFGSETLGLPDWTFSRYPDRFRTIPMRSREVRSLNLSSAVAVAAYEAARQLGFFQA